MLLATIGVTVVIRRLLQLSSPAPASGAALGGDFARHSLLTAVHIIPGLLFMILGPLQFVPGLRSRRPVLHRRSGRVFVASGIVIGTTALVMSTRMSIGGINQSVATMLFAVVFLFDLVKAFVAIRRGDVARHREWMIRAFAIGLAVATIRPIVGAFFATRRLSGLTPHEFFGTAFWLGFTLHLIAAEGWVNYTRTISVPRETGYRLGKQIVAQPQPPLRPEHPRGEDRIRPEEIQHPPGNGRVSASQRDILHRIAPQDTPRGRRPAAAWSTPCPTRSPTMRRRAAASAPSSTSGRGRSAAGRHIRHARRHDAHFHRPDRPVATFNCTSTRKRATSAFGGSQRSSR